MTIISSWGGNNSNCYVSISEANSFICSSVFDHSDWDACDDNQKEAALLEAVRDIDARQYIGSRYYYDQLLQHPRAFIIGFPWNRTATSSTVFSVEHHRLMLDVQAATCYQANWIVRNQGRNPHQEHIASGVAEYSESIGPIRETYNYGRKGRSVLGSMLCPEALARLQTWMTSKKIWRG